MSWDENESSLRQSRHLTPVNQQWLEGIFFANEEYHRSAASFRHRTAHNPTESYSFDLLGALGLTADPNTCGILFTIQGKLAQAARKHSTKDAMNLARCNETSSINCICWVSGK